MSSVLKNRLQCHQFITKITQDVQIAQVDKIAWVVQIAQIVDLEAIYKGSEYRKNRTIPYI